MKCQLSKFEVWISFYFKVWVYSLRNCSAIISSGNCLILGTFLSFQFLLMCVFRTHSYFAVKCSPGALRCEHPFHQNLREKFVNNNLRRRFYIISMCTSRRPQCGHSSYSLHLNLCRCTSTAAWSNGGSSFRVSYCLLLYLRPSWIERIIQTIVPSSYSQVSCNRFINHPFCEHLHFSRDQVNRVCCSQA